MPTETPLQAAERRIAEIARLQVLLNKRVKRLREAAVRGEWFDDLAYIESTLRDLVAGEREVE